MGISCFFFWLKNVLLVITNKKIECRFLMFHPLTPLAPDAETSRHGVCQLCVFLQNSGAILIGRSDRKTRSIIVILPRARSVLSAFPLCRSLPSDGAGAVEQSVRETPTEACPELGLQTRACFVDLPWGNN